MEVTAPPRASLADLDVVLDRLHTALDEATALPLDSLRPDQRRRWLTELQRIRARADSVTCLGLHAAQQLDASEVIVNLGHRSVADTVAARAKVNPRSLARDRKLALWLHHYATFSEAFAQGWVTREHLHVLRSLENRRTRPHLVEAQHYLIDAARRCTWAEFVAACRYWALTFDPDGEEPHEQAARRSVEYHKTADGMVSGRFTLDPIAGEAFVRAVEAQSQRLFREDTATGSDRTPAQRRADALVQLIARAAGSTGGRVPGALIHIVMSQRTAEDLINRSVPGGPSGDRLPLHPDDVDQRCELIDGTPLHPRFVLALLATATLRRMVFGPNSEIVDLGRQARGFSERLKQALLVRARGRCQVAGCAAPLAWLQADHVLPWTRHGPTSLANGQILCDPHNKAKRDRLPGPGGWEEAQAK